MLSRCILSVGIAALALVGCQTLPDVDTSVRNVAPSTHKVDAVLGSVDVMLAPADLQQGYLPPQLQALTPMWRNGVINALTQSQVFTPGANRRANIRINIIKIESKQNADLSSTTTSIASYEVIDSLTNETMWIRGISTTSTVSYKEAPIQSTRERLSLNRSIQTNISQFTQLFGKAQVEYTPVPQTEFRFTP